MKMYEKINLLDISLDEYLQSINISLDILIKAKEIELKRARTLIIEELKKKQRNTTRYQELSNFASSTKEDLFWLLNYKKNH